jgi:hypothetical protein
MPHLPIAARQAHIFLISTTAPLSRSANYVTTILEAHFNKLQVQILDGEQVILEGRRDHSTGLWHIPLQSSTSQPIETPSHVLPRPPANLANNVYELKKKHDIVQYLHQAAGIRPVPSTWIKASFPLHLWYRLIAQTTTTLNLLRPSRLNPKLSAEAHLNGAFDFNKTPLAPPGTRVLIHETVLNRRSWADHGVDGWYLGSADEHYRCYRVYVTKTAAERIACTLEFSPTTLPCQKHHPPTLLVMQQPT